MSVVFCFTQESAAEAAKVMPQTSDAATSCSDTDLATSSTEDPSNPAAEAQLGSPGRTYMQLYSAKEMNEDVGTEAQVRKHREAQSDRAIGQAALAGGQHVPLPVVPELEAHTADSALGMAKAVLHGNFTLIPRYAAGCTIISARLLSHCHTICFDIESCDFWTTKFTVADVARSSQTQVSAVARCVFAHTCLVHTQLSVHQAYNLLNVSGTSSRC